MRVLITGGSGFAARYMAALSRERAAEVFVATRGGSAPRDTTALHGDLRDRGAALTLVRQSRPDLVFHLAAVTPANTPQASTEEALLLNQQLCVHLLDAVRDVAPEARVLLVSSSAVYGQLPPEAMPIPETASLQPTTLYGISKAAVELLGMHYSAEYGLDVRRARPFNLIGTGEPAGMLTTTLATQVAEIAAHRRPPVVQVRHRGTARDYTDVRDAVRAYWAILESGDRNGVYNVCSGIAVPIGDLITKLLAIANLSAEVKETRESPAPGDIRVQAGDSGSLRRATQWLPSISLDASLEDLLRSVSSALAQRAYDSGR
jgi:GDP-4-dehydro-6-deoxy-D-mannose reductase